MNASTGTATGVIRLGEIAHTRSGDKGNHANIGVVAFTETGYTFLQSELTPERVTRFFAPLGVTRVQRYEMPRILGFNFVLYDVLAGGASQSLRIDTQGKLLGTAILDLELPLPDNAATMLVIRPD